MIIEIKDKVIYFKKDCKDCDKIGVCKFHQAMSDLCKTNLMYGMTRYAESNNCLKVFEIHSTCIHFKFKTELPKSGSAVTLDSGYEVLSRVVSNELKDLHHLQTTIEVEKDNVVCLLKFGSDSKSGKNEYKNFILSELIKDYIFA